MGCGSSNAANGGAGHKISQEDMIEARINTKFKENEIHIWYEAFMEEHPDGHMGLDGFTRLYARLYPNGDVTDFCKVLFRAYDTDQSGKIDFKEFIKTMSLASKGTQDQKLAWAYRLYDIDGSGQITKTEAVAIITSIYRMQGIDLQGNEFFMSPDETVETLWTALERDSDGKLSEKEFVVGSKLNPKLRKVLESI